MRNIQDYEDKIDSDKGDMYYSNHDGSEEEFGEEKESYSYGQRLIIKLDSVLGLNLQPEVPQVSTAFGSKKARSPWLKLPPAEGFPAMLQSYMGEVRAVEGSKRAGTAPLLPMDISRIFSNRHALS